MSRPEQKALYGRRLVGSTIQARADQGWSTPFASIPLTNNIKDGYRDITYAVFTNAIHRTAHWIRQHVGVSSEYETIAYVGPQDLRYQLFIMAAVKTGHVMLMVSPRNSEEAFRSLFDEAQVKTLITASAQLLPQMASAIKNSPMRHILAPSSNDLLNETSVETFPCHTPSFEEARMEPFLRLHTSGSTGLPRVITLKHGFLPCIDAFKLLDEDELQARYGGQRVMLSSPFFHVAGIIQSLAAVVFYDCTAVIVPPVPLTKDVVRDMINYADIEFAMMPPSILTDITKSPEHLQVLKKCKGVSFSGGPLAESAAEVVAQQTQLFSSIGATEWALVPMRAKDATEPNYFHFNEDWQGIEFRPSDSPDLFELVIVRNDEMKLLQAVFTTFPEIDEYETKDLFAPHPTKKHHWRYVSRRDDIIVFSNGEKLNPVTMEGKITQCEAVSGCLVVGQGRFQSALLVEPKDATIDSNILLEQVWPFIEAANKTCPRHGQVVKAAVFFTQPGKPLVRAGKGTIQRAPNNRLFASEIEEIYSDLDSKSSEQAPSVELDLSTEVTTKCSLRRFIAHQLDLGDLADHQDIFASGMDSLQLVSLVRAINASKPGEPVDAKHVYDNPTIDKLVRLLHASKPPKDYSDFDSDDEDEKAVWYSMDSLFDKYAKSLPHDPDQRRHKLRSALKSHNHAPITQPDGGWEAWLQVIGSLLININNWGLVNSWSIFQAYYQESFLSDKSASEIAWIGTLQGALLLIVGVLSGPLFDKGYFRMLLVGAGLGLVFALMMVSISTEHYQFILAQGLLAGICSGLLYIPSIAVVPLYFKKHRGLALGIATAGGSLGGIIYPLVFRALLNSIGFGWAVRVIAFIALFTITLATLMIKPIGPRTSRQLIDWSAFTDPPTATFMVQAFFLFAGVLVPYSLCTTYAIGSVHTSTDLGFNLVAVINAAQLVGRVVPGALSDYMGGDWMLFLGIFCSSILGFCWIAVHDIGGYIVWLIVFGFFSGIVATLPACVLPYLSPSLGVIGTRLGMVYASAGVGFLISTPVATAANQSTGGFLGSQVWIGAVCFAAAIFSSYTTYEAWSRRRLYESRKKRKFGRV